MVERCFDVVVHAFGLRAAESLSGALERIVELDASEAARLSAALPCAVLANVSYARAESVAASLLLAGADARIAPHAANSESRGYSTLLEIGLAKDKESAPNKEGELAPLGAGREPSVPPLRIASEHPRWLAVQPANKPPSIAAPVATHVESVAALAPAIRAARPASSAPAAPAREARIAPLAAFAPKAAAAAAQLQRASELPHRVSTAAPAAQRVSEHAAPNPAPKLAARAAPKLELARSALVDVAIAADSAFSADFGLHATAELDAVFAKAPPVSNAAVSTDAVASSAASNNIDEASPARGESFGSLALPLELAVSLPSKTARTAPPVAVAPRALAPASSPPPSSTVATARRASSQVAPLPPAPNDLLLPPRTLWLLGILWLSVALLLWTNGLLF